MLACFSDGATMMIRSFRSTQIIIRAIDVVSDFPYWVIVRIAARRMLGSYIDQKISACPSVKGNGSPSSVLKNVFAIVFAWLICSFDIFASTI